MPNFKKTARFIVALVCLTSAFLLSVEFNNRGVQFDLRHSDGAARDKDERAYDLSALRILNRVLLHLKDSYVEPERIDPPKMLLSALEEIQNSLAEVVVDYDRRAKEAPAKIIVSVNEQQREFDIEGIQSLWEMSFKLKEIFGFIQDTLGDDPDVKYQDIEYAAINGMLETLDPHSTLLPPRNYEEMQTQTGGKFGGLGIVISVRDGKLTVISPIDGTPAAREGIKSQDHIVRIGEESTVNMSLNEAVNMLRGEPGTEVTLWVKRKGWDEPRKFIVERATIKIESVTSQPLDDKIGYLRIKNFQANTFADTKRHLAELKDKMGGLQGLVLDLRDNPGGLLDQSIRISDLFIDDGALVSTVGQGNKLREKKMAMRSGTEPKYPIIVLVNPGSASASEIVSGAIQNNNRGVVMGDTTFGKGSVQVIYEFPDKSALKLTVAQYLTPGDISIQGKGIIPDLRAVPVSVDDKNVDLFLSRNVVRESDLATALTNGATRDAATSKHVRYLREPVKAGDEFTDPDAFRSDFEIELAQRLLVTAGDTWQREQMLEAIQPELERTAKTESSKIRAALKKQGVDWTAGPSPVNPSYTLDFKTSLEDGEAARAGSSFTITATMTNTGAETIYQAKALTDSDNGVLSDREFIFGKLAPGEAREWSVEVKLPQDMERRRDMMRFEVSDRQNTYDPIARQPRLPVSIEALARPHFALSYEIADPSGDGLLQTGEEITFKLHVHNSGEADSAETLVYLKNRSRDAIYLKRGRTKISSIKAGGSESVEFTFTAKKAPEGGFFELELDVYDTIFREFTQKTLKLPYVEEAANATDVGGVVTLSKEAALRAGAADTVPATGKIAAGATLPVTGKLDGWWRVEFNGRRAFVPAAAATHDPDGQANGGTGEFVLFESPRISLTPEAMMTSKSTINLKGLFKDNSSIKDYYVFVYNRVDSTINTRKVNYQRVNSSSTDLEMNVPLFEGMNRIAVYVRDDEGMTATQSAYVYRK